MKIKRTVYHKEGYKKIGQEVEIELTPEELREAYEEKQFEYDRQDIADMFVGLNDDQCKEEHGIVRVQAEAMYDEMAKEMRINITKYDMHWDTARDEAIRDVIARNLLEPNTNEKEKWNYKSTYRQQKG